MVKKFSWPVKSSSPTQQQNTTIKQQTVVTPLLEEQTQQQQQQQQPPQWIHRLSTLHDSLEQAEIKTYMSLKNIMESKLGRPTQVSWSHMKTLTKAIRELCESHQHFQSATSAFLAKEGMITTSPHSEDDIAGKTAITMAPEPNSKDMNSSSSPEQMKSTQQVLDSIEKDGPGVIADTSSQYTIMPPTATPIPVTSQPEPSYIIYNALSKPPEQSSPATIPSISEESDQTPNILPEVSSPDILAASVHALPLSAVSQPLEVMPDENAPPPPHIEAPRRRRSTMTLHSTRKSSVVSLLRNPEGDTSIPSLAEEVATRNRSDSSSRNSRSTSNEETSAQVPSTDSPPNDILNLIVDELPLKLPGTPATPAPDSHMPIMHEPPTPKATPIEPKISSEYADLTQDQIIDQAVVQFRSIVQQVQSMDALFTKIQAITPSENVQYEATDTGQVRRFGVRERFKDMIKGCGAGAGSFGGIWARGSCGEMWMNDLLGVYVREKSLQTLDKDNPKVIFYDPPPKTNPKLVPPPTLIPLEEFLTWLVNCLDWLPNIPKPEREIIEDAVSRLGGWKHAKVFGLDWFRQFYRFQPLIPYPLPSCLNVWYWQTLDQSCLNSMYSEWWLRTHAKESVPRAAILSRNQMLFLDLLTLRDMILKGILGNIVDVSSAEVRLDGFVDSVSKVRLVEQGRWVLPLPESTERMTPTQTGAKAIPLAHDASGAIWTQGTPGCRTGNFKKGNTTITNFEEPILQRDALFVQPYLKDPRLVELRERAIIISAFFSKEKYGALLALEKAWESDPDFADMMGGRECMMQLLQVTESKPQSHKENPKLSFNLGDSIKGLFRKATLKLTKSNSSLQPPTRVSSANTLTVPRGGKSTTTASRYLPEREVAARVWPVADRVVEFYLTMELGSRYQGV